MDMYLSKVFERFVEKSPVSVMARATMEHALAPESMFDRHLRRAGEERTKLGPRSGCHVAAGA
jgi:hypothetical protein